MWQDCLHGEEAKQEKQMGQKKEEQDGELVCYSFTDQEQKRISGF